LGLPGAIVLTQPVPEAEALDDELMRTALEAALNEATIRRIGGKSLTPFLLDSIRQATLGRGLHANCELLIANARLAAEIAAALLDSHGGP
jgi:pseudouridylate synthase